MIVVLLLTMVAFENGSGQTRLHRDYVADEKTAERIAEAVLISLYGRERVSTEKPLHVESAGKDLWLVQGVIRNPEATGGNFGVWINKHSGCLSIIEHMK
jgi:hypothetical protein